MASIAAVFEEVNRRHVQFGLVPLENSTDGRVADTLDMFIKLPNLKIRAEVRLRVHHCLLGRCEWSQVRRVYSKSQALSQCRNWLGKNVPQATKVEVVSTAAAAELAQREEFAAAVASRAAASAYRLNVLAENIEDQPHNVTRFAVIGERAEERTGRDKTTLMIRLPNQAGSLAKTISPFEKFGVNMTWIESFPIPGIGGGKGGETNPSYLFFVDVEGHQTDKAVRRPSTWSASAASISTSSAHTPAATASRADLTIVRRPTPLDLAGDRSLPDLRLAPHAPPSLPENKGGQLPVPSRSPSSWRMWRFSAH